MRTPPPTYSDNLASLSSDMDRSTVASTSSGRPKRPNQPRGMSSSLETRPQTARRVTPPIFNPLQLAESFSSPPKSGTSFAVTAFYSPTLEYSPHSPHTGGHNTPGTGRSYQAASGGYGSSSSLPRTTSKWVTHVFVNPRDELKSICPFIPRSFFLTISQFHDLAFSIVPSFGVLYLTIATRPDADYTIAEYPAYTFRENRWSAKGRKCVR